MSGIVRKKCCCDEPCLCTPGGADSVTITFTDGAPCFECHPNNAITLSGGFSGTFVVPRTGTCQFIYDAPYTATQLRMYGAGCGDEFRCGTDRINIRFEILGSGEFRLTVQIYNSDPTHCDPCTLGTIVGFLFYKPTFPIDLCSDGAEVEDVGICDSTSESFCNFFTEAPFDMTVGGTATITL